MMIKWAFVRAVLRVNRVNELLRLEKDPECMLETGMGAPRKHKIRQRGLPDLPQPLHQGKIKDGNLPRFKPNGAP